MYCKLLLLFPVLAFAIKPSEALDRLVEGNQRYAGDRLTHPDRTSDRREEVAAGQTPFAVIVGCSDSRVPPEIVFDQGVGDLFIVRVAGNVVGPIELDSIEYGVAHLGAALVMVVGHEACGAVNAVFKGKDGDIEDVAKLIKPAIQGAKSADGAVQDNVRWVVAALKKSPVLKRSLKNGSLSIVGGYYHLGTGQVEVLK